MKGKTDNTGNVVAVINTDVELWREPSELEGMSHYAASIHRTADNKIGIDVGGFVKVKSLREWHKLDGVEPSNATLPPNTGKPLMRICRETYPLTSVAYEDVETTPNTDNPLLDEILKSLVSSTYWTKEPVEENLASEQDRVKFVDERIESAKRQIQLLVLKEQKRELEHFWDLGAEHGIDNRIAELDHKIKEIEG